MSTSDVPLETLRKLGLALSPDLELEVDERQVFYRSAEPPSWVTFLAGSDWWMKALAAYAALYVAEIVKEAAKYTWHNRAKAIAAAVAGASSLKKLATGIAQLRERLSSRTSVGIGLPVPDEYFTTRLELLGSDPVDLELQIAIFVHHLPGLTALIRNEGLEDGRVIGGLRLQLLPDGSLEVSWLSSDSRAEQRRVLRL